MRKMQQNCPLTAQETSRRIVLMTNLTSEDTLAVLRWLVEAGADEAIADSPVDRFKPRSAVPLAGEKTAPMARHLREESHPLSSLQFPCAEPGSARQVENRNLSAAAEAVSLSTLPGTARALAQSCTTLDALKSALAGFEGCELKRLASNTVFADGNPESRIMLIGEAPGRDEDAQGLPFVGRAGKLLDRMLDAIGLNRTRVYITNVLPWRPPANRNPSLEEAAICLPFLHRHIELARPELLILLGAVSVRHVLGIDEGITRVRGRWELYQSAGLGRTIPAMLTLHPAFLLRQPAAKRLAWRDLLAVAEKIEALRL
jgi:uracil-DNA glycosylase